MTINFVFYHLSISLTPLLPHQSNCYLLNLSLLLSLYSWCSHSLPCSTLSYSHHLFIHLIQVLNAISKNFPLSHKVGVSIIHLNFLLQCINFIYLQCCMSLWCIFLCPLILVAYFSVLWFWVWPCDLLWPRRYYSTGQKQRLKMWLPNWYFPYIPTFYHKKYMCG